MNKIKKNFGFGCMRLPMISKEEVDIKEFTKMVDLFIESGFNYFDTAHGYLNGLSEKALRVALVDRYDRSKYILTDKLTDSYFNSLEEIEKIFNEQLNILGVDYFDFYLMHCQMKYNYDKFNNLGAYDFAVKMKEEGKIRHLGISFHDSPEFLDKILTEHPEIEIVQIQFNYLDFENPQVESKKCYEVARRHNKPLIIMEPVRGGVLANLPSEANNIIDLEKHSAATYAIKFAASFEGVKMVLSGMSNLSQMEDNLSVMKDFTPFNDDELKLLYNDVTNLIIKVNQVPCTACKYCVDGCPKHINIPEIFKYLNELNIYHSWSAKRKYNKLVEDGSGKASDCLKCGKCEKACPQHIKIREYLEKAKEAFEKE